MSKLIKILKAFSMVIIGMLITALISAFSMVIIGMLIMALISVFSLVIILLFSSILYLGIWILTNISSYWTAFGIFVGIIIIYFTIGVYKNI